MPREHKAMILSSKPPHRRWPWRLSSAQARITMSRHQDFSFAKITVKLFGSASIANIIPIQMTLFTPFLI